MHNHSVREKVLERLQNLLGAIQSGLIVEPSNALPEPIVQVMDACDDQASVDGWSPSPQTDLPTLNTNTSYDFGNSINLIKTGSGTNAPTWAKLLSTSFDATGKIVVMALKPTVSKLAVANALTLRAGSSPTDYYEYQVGSSAMVDQAWQVFGVNIDGGIQGGPPVTQIVGNPDKTAIILLQIELKLANATITLAADEMVMDYWIIYDVAAWLPSGGARVPELIFDNQAVTGSYSIGTGHIPNSDALFGLVKTFLIPFDGTGGDIECWIFVKDKTKLSNSPPNNYSVGILAGSDSANWYGRFLFHNDLRDQVNDRGNGWNRIIFDPLTESDIIAGTPTINNLAWFTIGGIALNTSIDIPIGDFRLDLVRIIGPTGTYSMDIKKVYRYAIASQQTPGTPSIMMSAIDEDREPEIYPEISARLRVGLDVEIELPAEYILDQELGRAADNIQIAIASQRDLWGIARYMRIVSLSFHAREGIHTGIVTIIVEIGFTFNQDDPTKQGV